MACPLLVVAEASRLAAGVLSAGDTDGFFFALSFSPPEGLRFIAPARRPFCWSEDFFLSGGGALPVVAGGDPARVVVVVVVVVVIDGAADVVGGGGEMAGGDCSVALCLADTALWIQVVNERNEVSWSVLLW